MARLSINPTILMATTAEGAITYDTASNRFQELNSMATLLVGLADGTRTGSEIAFLAVPQLSDVEGAAVDAWLDQAVRNRLLVDESDSSQGRALEKSANELDELSFRLRDQGHVDAAYLCQKRAVELTPNEPEFVRELGELAHIVGRRNEARAAFEDYLLLNPGDAEVRHLLTPLRGEATPARVPDECIRQLYGRFATNYEENMCEELAYAGPGELKKAVDQAFGDRQGLSILELGCGTGLAGTQIASRAARLVGVDLSPEMISKARRRKIYDELHVAEVTSWMESAKDQFDLILACDTLIYFGDLTQVIGLCKRMLAPLGVIAFSVERADSGTFRLTDNGRFVHHIDHISEVVEATQMEKMQVTEAFVRTEYGESVVGLIVTLRSRI